MYKRCIVFYMRKSKNKKFQNHKSKFFQKSKNKNFQNFKKFFKIPVINTNTQPKFTIYIYQFTQYIILIQ